MPSRRYRRNRILQQNNVYAPVYIVSPGTTTNNSTTISITEFTDSTYLNKIKQLQVYICNAIQLLASTDTNDNTTINVTDVIPLLKNILYSIVEIINYYRTLDLIDDSSGIYKPVYTMSDNFEDIQSTVFSIIDNIGMGINSKIVSSRVQYLRDLLVTLY